MASGVVFTSGQFVGTKSPLRVTKLTEVKQVNVSQSRRNPSSGIVDVRRGGGLATLLIAKSGESPVPLRAFAASLGGADLIRSRLPERAGLIWMQE